MDAVATHFQLKYIFYDAGPAFNCRQIDQGGKLQS